MELSLTMPRPPPPIVALLGPRRMLARLTAFLITPGPFPSAAPGAEEGWRSYAVYSGALPLRRHKSLRRYS